MDYENDWNNYLNQFDKMDPSIFQNITKNTNRFCIIIEPREHPLLEKVLRNFIFLLSGKGWGFIICHGTKNETYVKNITKNWSNIILHNTSYQDLPGRVYNELMLSIHFWEALQRYGCQTALIFQTDVVLLNNNIDPFLRYDYVGSPWNPSFKWPIIKCKIFVGNGGFSLRNVKSIIDCLKKYKKEINYATSEDVFFSYYLNQLYKRIPDLEQASKFGCETYYKHDPVGLHKPQSQYFPPGKLKQLLSKRWL
jgi:hypothetical protein